MGAVELAYDLFEPDEPSPDDSIPILLMHGLFWNKYVFRDIASALSRKLKTKVFSLDLRNHGESPAPKECDIYLMAEDVKKFMRDKDLKKANFVCHSLSNSVSYLVLLDQPSSIHKLVLIDNAPFPDLTDYNNKKYMEPQVKCQNRLLDTLDPKMTLINGKKKFYSLAASGNKSQEYFYKKVAYDLTKENGKFKWKVDLEFLSERYASGALVPKPRGSSDHEMLLLRCQDTRRVTDKKFEEIYKYNPKAKLVTFKNSTHVLMFERPDTFIEIVQDFLCSNNSNEYPTKRIV